MYENIVQLKSDLFIIFDRMKREKKLEAIYKEIANKELSFGCRVDTECWRTVSIVEETSDERWYIVVSEESLYNDEDIGAYYCWLRVRWLETMEQIDIAEIIWHPVMLGAIFERYSKNRGYINSQFIISLIAKWTWYDKSIEEQSDECVNFVYSLIKK